MDKALEEFLSLFEVDLKEGTIHLLGERIVLFNTEVLGLWRTELIETLGVEKSRHVLTRMGYLYGQHDYQMVKRALPEADPASLARVVKNLASISGTAVMRNVGADDLSSSESGKEFAIEWANSIEATLQLEMLGESDLPSCWMMMGYATGYASALFGRRVLFVETECIGQGAERCRAVGRLDEDWGDEANLIRSHLNPIDLEGMLRHLAATVEEQKETLQRSEAEISRLRRTAVSRLSFSDIIGESRTMREAISVAERAAKFDTTVLIQGNSGTGKEILARGIHRASGRKDAAFLAIDCGALAETLLESELFGYRRGAFTGADRDYEGLLRSAHGGTILLDEISEISPALQMKLLRVLQEKEVRPVGSSQPVKVDVRILAASNRDLEQLVLRGQFREDLFYRLNVIAIRLPSLRERENDVLLLADHFLRVFAERHHQDVVGFTPEARRTLLSASWPGNVRQLQNVVERAVILGDQPYIDVVHLPDGLTSSGLGRVGEEDMPEVRAAGRSIEDPEAREILAVLARSGGSRTRAARTLDISRSTLWRRMKRLGLA